MPKLLLDKGRFITVTWSDDDSYRGKNVSELDPVYTSEFINNVLNGNRREFVSYKDKTGNGSIVSQQ